MAGEFLLFDELASHVAPFLAIFGLSYFFVEVGPKTTTSAMPSEVIRSESERLGQRHGDRE